MDKRPEPNAAPPPGRWQFTLRAALVAVFLLCVVFAVPSWIGYVSPKTADKRIRAIIGESTRIEVFTDKETADHTISNKAAIAALARALPAVKRASSLERGPLECTGPFSTKCIHADSSEYWVGIYCDTYLQVSDGSHNWLFEADLSRKFPLKVVLQTASQANEAGQQKSNGNVPLPKNPKAVTSHRSPNQPRSGASPQPTASDLPVRALGHSRSEWPTLWVARSASDEWVIPRLIGSGI